MKATDMKKFSTLSGFVSVLVLGMISAVTAQASEPIAIEPEGEETVKVCDKYGPGFVYIPGTETCVRISGSVRVTYSVATGK